MSLGEHVTRIMRLIGECNGCAKDRCEEWCWEFVRQEVEHEVAAAAAESLVRGGAPSLGMAYSFPDNMRAASETVEGQALKVCEEAQETARAAVCEGPARIIEEAWDTVHACEGLLRKFPLKDVANGRLMVEEKGRRRGDYFA